MNEQNRKNTIKTVKTVLSALWWMFVIALAALLLNIISAKVKGDVPKVFGFSVMYIVSGSMEDEIPVGTYILIKECDPEEIEKGDIICFYSDDPMIKDYPNTHRVISEPVKTEEGIRFETKGDASAVPDACFARGERFIGKYEKNLDGLTAFAKMLSGGGMIVIIAVMTVAVALMTVYTAFRKDEGSSPSSEKETEDSEKE